MDEMKEEMNVLLNKHTESQQYQEIMRLKPQIDLLTGENFVDWKEQLELVLETVNWQIYLQKDTACEQGVKAKLKLFLRSVVSDQFKLIVKDCESFFEFSLRVPPSQSQTMYTFIYCDYLNLNVCYIVKLCVVRQC